jgi:acyl-CoA thioesterase I
MPLPLLMNKSIRFFLLFYFFALLLAGANLLYAQPEDTQTILFFGDSITAGSGIDEDDAFPALIQEKIDSLGMDYEVINAGSSGETSAGGLRRIDWMMRRDIDIFVLELGGNDGLRGVDLSSTKENLQQIIDKVKGQQPDVEIIIAGMQIPTNLGEDYTARFRNIFPELAEENNATLIPFLLEGVGGNEDLNQSDGIHPTEEGHKVVAENVWKVLEPVLRDQ